MWRRPDDELHRVYREHVDAVYAFFAYAIPRSQAEDLTSATFEKVIKAWRRYDPQKASERTWILAIARNVLTDHHRRQQHRQAVSTDEHPALLDLLQNEEVLERRLDRDELLGWLAELQPREQELLALRYGADMTANEIAELTELSVANVHQILSRALKKLRATASPLEPR